VGVEEPVEERPVEEVDGEFDVRVLGIVAPSTGD
jgi:hypothetical protein